MGKTSHNRFAIVVKWKAGKIEKMKVNAAEPARRWVSNWLVRRLLSIQGRQKMKNFKEGYRVRVVGHHPWMANRDGVIKQVDCAKGNRFLVKFDHDESRTWHDEDGDPVLLLGDRDLVLTDNQQN